MVVADDSGLPIAVCVMGARPHEVRLAACLVRERPKRLIIDRAYDSDPLDACLKARGIEIIAPHLGNRRKLRTRDGRKLWRYKRRWKIERLFA
ncbi:transposase [Thermodesulforhabdus norvegica]|uniref:transposase n=1 Tax=Thermodesulforhabdus norvegica TaxID=39841 RepID=UPI00318467D5